MLGNVALHLIAAPAASPAFLSSVHCIVVPARLLGCVHCAVATLVATCNAVAIAQRNHLPRFIIIVQTLDDVTLQSWVAIIAPLTLNLGCHLHYPIAPRPLLTATAVL